MIPFLKQCLLSETVINDRLSFDKTCQKLTN